MGLVALFKAGGITMYPLLICSLVIWAIIFEKLWDLFKFKKEFRSLYGISSPLVKNGKIDEIKGIYSQAAQSIKGPYIVLFENSKTAREDRDKSVSRKLQESHYFLKKRMWVLGTLGSAAPFLGLFGTVAGIIRSFDSIAISGKSNFSVVASGLSEALITTAAGILIAVVAVIFYNYFQVKINHICLEFRNQLEDFSDMLENVEVRNAD